VSTANVTQLVAQRLVRRLPIVRRDSNATLADLLLRRSSWPPALPAWSQVNGRLTPSRSDRALPGCTTHWTRSGHARRTRGLRDGLGKDRDRLNSSGFSALAAAMRLVWSVPVRGSPAALLLELLLGAIDPILPPAR
jgi:hypothetical protein